MSDDETATLRVLGRVPFLAGLDPEVHLEIAELGEQRRLAEGEVLVAELEAGDELYVLLEGEIEVSVGTGSSLTPRHLGHLVPGDTIGEVSLFTGEVRSATATARGRARVLALGHDRFLALCRRHPRIAVGLSRVLAARQQATDRAVTELLDEQRAAKPAAGATRPGSVAAAAASGDPVAAGPLLPVPPPRRWQRAWAELVRSRRQELPFLVLLSFLGALLVARLAVWGMLQLGQPILPVLRGFYLGGLGLTVLSSLLALLYFRPGWRRAIAIGYGAGLALAFNELSVFLAFDVFYLDMTTKDPKLEFNVELLYRRSESFYALVLLFGVAVQATYLRRFYSRLLLEARLAVGRLWHRH